MPDIVITEFMDARAVKSLSDEFDTLYDPDLFKSEARMIEAVRDARALIVRNQTQVRGALLDAAPKLIAAARLGVGLDNFDLDDCKARGIAVLPALGSNEDSVAEFVLGSLFVHFRGSFFGTEKIVAGTWPRNSFINGREIAGKTLGIIGFGQIGLQVSRRAQAMGMNVVADGSFRKDTDAIWAETNVKPLKLDELLAVSDAITLHVPLTAGTRNLVSAERIALMKKDAIIINFARGGVVDDVALCAALKEGRLGGASLDVFEQEPLPVENPYHGVPNLILSTHVAGTTQESNFRASTISAANIRKALLAQG